MCGRFTITLTIGFAERFSVINGVFPDHPRYNIAPGQPVPVIVGTREGNASVAMTWGLVPAWAKEGPVARPLINARAESLLSRPAFRGPVRHQRCLVPATGFYEWTRDGKTRTPFYFKRKDGDLFAFAGLFDRWSPGGPGGGFAIVTTSPNGLVAPVHDRMPAILAREDEKVWLGSPALSEDTLARILGPYPAGKLEAIRVSPAVNNPSAEGESLVRPASQASLF